MKKHILQVIECVMPLIIAIVSIILFVLVAGGDINRFYVDDNAMQWGPITDKAFDILFSEGYLPYRNIYQYKGLDIFSSGYHGVSNPVMLLAYVISRFVFSYELNTLCVYMCIMYILGNIFMYAALRKFDLKESTIIISLLMYACTTVFVANGYYYFTYNSYFFIPFLIWLILSVQNSKLWYVVPGVALAFSVSLGHVQYSFYYTIVYCIICVVFAFHDRRIKSLLPMFVNLISFLALSGCSLMLMVMSSQDRELILEQNEDFMTFPVNVFELFMTFDFSFFKTNEQELIKYFRPMIDDNPGVSIAIYLVIIMFVPYYKKWGAFIYNNWNHRWISEDILAKYKITHWDSYIAVMKYLLVYEANVILWQELLGIFVEETHFHFLFWCPIIIWGIILVVSILSKTHFLIMKKMSKSIVVMLFICKPFWAFIIVMADYIYGCFKKKKCTKYTPNETVMYACVLAFLFFLFLAMGEETPVAIFMSKLPVINGFRYLYKCYFIFVPLMMIVAAWQLDKIVLYRKAVCTVAVLGALFALINSIYLVNGEKHYYMLPEKFPFDRYEEYKKEAKELFERENMDVSNYRLLACIDVDGAMGIIDESSSECLYKFNKNIATAYDIFSIGGYDNIFTYESFLQSDAIQADIYNEGMFTNQVVDVELWEQWIENVEGRAEFETQMIANGVKYIIFTRDNYEFIDSFRVLINMCDELTIIREFNGLEDTIIMELEGINALCTNAETKQKVEIESLMSELSFGTDSRGSYEVKISLTYDEHYMLSYMNDVGAIQYIAPKKTSDGYISAEIPAGTGNVRLYYVNHLMDVAVIFTVGVSAAMVLIVIGVVTKGNVKKQKIEIQGAK